MTTTALADHPLSIIAKERTAHMKHMSATKHRGAITWREEASQLHTQSPDQAQAWRNHGLDVTPIIDADEITELISREGIVWVTP